MCSCGDRVTDYQSANAQLANQKINLEMTPNLGSPVYLHGMDPESPTRIEDLSFRPDCEFQLADVTYGLATSPEEGIALRLPDGTVHIEGQTHNQEALQVFAWLRKPQWVVITYDEYGTSADHTFGGSLDEAEAIAREHTGHDASQAANHRDRTLVFEGIAASALVYLDAIDEMSKLLDY